MGFCDGKQGAYLQISGNGLDQTLITGGGSYQENTNSTPDGLAYWTVYTGTTDAAGKFIEAARGTFLKKHSQYFGIWSVPQSGTTSWRINLLPDSPTSILRSWTYPRANWITRVVFSSGNQPVTTYTTRVLSATGSELWKGSSTLGYYTVSVLECGCPDSDCQHGSFPTNFCCTNCGQQAALLQEIISALQARNNG